jgi:hypothetical protein
MNFSLLYRLSGIKADKAKTLSRVNPRSDFNVVNGLR